MARAGSQPCDRGGTDLGGDILRYNGRHQRKPGSGDGATVERLVNGVEAEEHARTEVAVSLHASRDAMRWPPRLDHILTCSPVSLLTPSQQLTPARS